MPRLMQVWATSRSTGGRCRRIWTATSLWRGGHSGELLSQVWWFLHLEGTCRGNSGSCRCHNWLAAAPRPLPFASSTAALPPACCASCLGPAVPCCPGLVPHRAACRLHCFRPRRCPLPPPSPNRQEDSSVKFQCNDTVKITFDATDNQRVKVTLQYKDAFTQKPVSGRQAS